MPMVGVTSARSPGEFGLCFTQVQERSGHAWAYLPSESGGTFTDYGARGAAASYWLQVRRAGQATHLRLVSAIGAAPLSGLVEVVEQCR